MADFTYEDLKKQYDYFRMPIVKITVKGKDISADKAGLAISDIEVENTCGFEASIATFWIYNCYEDGSFQIDKKYIAIGSCVSISIGYASSVREVFRGFISKVNFSFRQGEMPGVEVTAMDVKGIMMSGNYSRQLKATSWSDAVAEIMENTAYSKLQSSEIIKKLEISETPDKKDALEGLSGGLLDAVPGVSDLTDNIPGVSDLADNIPGGGLLDNIPGASDIAGGISDAVSGVTDSVTGTVNAATGAATGAAGAVTGAMDAAAGAADAAGKLNSVAGNIPGVSGVPGTVTDKSIEMVCESDYEFVVKAAKKFNFEFFTNAGTVYFRKAKEYKDILMEIEPNPLLRSCEVSYDITGLAGKVEVRAMDAGKASEISSSKNLDNKISQSNLAKPLVKGTKKVYIDPTVSSKKDAGYRAEYLAEDIAYRYGTLEAELVGLPELVPGRFVMLKGLGTPVSNLFYIVTVRHILNGDGEYITKITGKASSIDGATKNTATGLDALTNLADTVSDVANMASDVADMASSASDMVSGISDTLSGGLDVSGLTGGLDASSLTNIAGSIL